jgi:hypothetical protein
MARRWLISIAVIGTLAVLAVISILILATNTGTSRQTSQLIERLTVEAAEVAAQASPMLRSTQKETPVSASVQDPGFVIHRPQAQLIADGRSRITLTVQTTNPAFVGRNLIFNVTGGGFAEPAQIILPALGETVPVDYVAGESASTIRIEGVVTIGAAQRSVSVYLTAEGEASLSLVGMIDLEADLTPPVSVPIVLKMIRPNDLPVAGEYQVRAFANGGGFTGVPGTNPVSPYDLILDGSTAAIVYFVPDAQQQSGSIQAQVIGRADIPPFESLIRWTNITARLGWLTPNEPGRLMTITGDELICLQAFDSQDVVIRPNVLNLRYDSLLGSTSLRNEKIPLEVGRSYSSDAGLLSYTYEDDSACFSLAAQDGQGGLIVLTVWADGQASQVDALALLHFGETAPLDTTQSITALFASGTLLTFDRATMPPLYSIRSDLSSTGDFSHILLFWIPAVQVDASSGKIIEGVPIMMYTGLDHIRAGNVPLLVSTDDGLQGYYVDMQDSEEINGALFYRGYAVVRIEADRPTPMPPPLTTPESTLELTIR